ncbi:MAG: hypothetical protein U9R01_02530, partial [candidate division WOR-3 bacterium]|nr:hypothetical protein [candidate division WOR-3 bacterium]
IKRCDIMKKYFPEQNVEFKTANVFNIDINDDINVCLCFGGLYHISNPQDLLCKLYNSKILYLVVQSVTSIKFEDENYFVTPAPCCNRGCRFSHKKLLSMIKEAGWEIVREGRNEIIYNKPVSRGSSYVLCRR